MVGAGALIFAGRRAKTQAAQQKSTAAPLTTQRADEIATPTDDLVGSVENKTDAALSGEARGKHSAN